MWNDAASAAGIRFVVHVPQRVRDGDMLVAHFVQALAMQPNDQRPPTDAHAWMDPALRPVFLRSHGQVRSWPRTVAAALAWIGCCVLLLVIRRLLYY